MVFKFISNLKNSENGTTLIEIAVVLFIIALFFTIMIIGLPEIERRFALSRSTYRLAQDLRKARDLSISGVKIKDNEDNEAIPQGYGVYIDRDRDLINYVIYADVSGVDQMYTASDPYNYCNEAQIGPDCVIDIVDVSKENPSLYIKRLTVTAIGIGGEITASDNNTVSINFLPPNPDVRIVDPFSGEDFNSIEIVLGIDGSSNERIVFINKAGLINIQ